MNAIPRPFLGIWARAEPIPGGRYAIPVTLLIICVLLYPNFGRLTEALIVMLSVPGLLLFAIWSALGQLRRFARDLSVSASPQ